MDKSRYPPNWNEISYHIRFERAKGRCEQCGVKHGEIIFRYISSPVEYLALSDPDFEEKLYFEGDDIGDKAVKVVITVHHIGIDKPDGSPGSPHDKMDCRPENLLALCQRCHLLADLPENVKSRKRTRIRKKHNRFIEAGQRSMFDEP